jgi:hypothetical protein
MPHLIAAVYVQNPATHEELVLLPGESPAPEIAALVTNPDAWDVHLDASGQPAAELAEPLADADPAVQDDRSATSGGSGTKKAGQRLPRPTTS